MILQPKDFQDWLSGLGRCPTGQEIYDFIRPTVDDMLDEAVSDGYSEGRYAATPNAD